VLVEQDQVVDPQRPRDVFGQGDFRGWTSLRAVDEAACLFDRPSEGAAQSRPEGRGG